MGARDEGGYECQINTSPPRSLVVEVQVVEARRKPVEVLGSEAVVAGAMAEVLGGAGGKPGLSVSRVEANQPVVAIQGGDALSEHQQLVNVQVRTSCCTEGTWPT